MSDKLALLKAIDGMIYQPWLKQIKQYHVEAKKLNNGNPLSYLFFKGDRISYTSPTKEAKEYLDSKVGEFTEVINERAIINAYLLKFTNNVPNYYFSVVLLLTPKIIIDRFPAYRNSGYDDSLKSIIEIYQQMPEYNLIKKRVFLGGMYGN